MSSPRPQGNKSYRTIGLIAFAFFIVLLIVTIVLPIKYNATSLPVTVVSGVISILGLFLSFLQAFPNVRDALIQTFSITHFPTITRNQWLFGLLIVVLVGLNIFQTTIIINATRQKPPPPITPTPNSFPKTPVPPNFLYQENWSQGKDGWIGDSQWTVNSNGILTSDGNASESSYYMLAPYQPPTANYAVEVQIQFLQFMNFPGPATFGIFVRSGTNEDEMGYQAYILDGFAKIRIAHDPTSKVLKQTTYPLDFEWHTYRIEIKNSIISFLIDNNLLAQATDTTFTLPGRVGLFDNNCRLNVRSFTVLPL